MRVLLITSLLGAAAALVGCGDDSIPPAEMAKEAVYKAAKDELLDGMKIVDFERDNGWADPNSRNQYIVRYKYKVRLEKDFAQIVLPLAKESAESAHEKQSKFNNELELLNMNARLVTMSAQSDFEARMNDLLASCNECRNYIDDSTTKPSRKVKFIAYIANWHYLINDLNFGLNEKQTKGTELNRTYWRTFLKTEQGWMPAS